MADHHLARRRPLGAVGKWLLKRLLFSSDSVRKLSSSAPSVRAHGVGIILASFRWKGPRPSFFLQTKPCQGLSITWTPEDTQQKAWGKALIFRSPFSFLLLPNWFEVHLELP
jgi:hypothetical protein